MNRRLTILCAVAMLLIALAQFRMPRNSLDVALSAALAASSDSELAVVGK
jgi:hypothetical protein